MRDPARLTAWQPSIGAWPDFGGVRFRVWAPEHDRVDVVFWRYGAETSRRLERQTDGSHSAWVPGIEAGTPYKYRLPDGQLLPDPASRFQPDGVHGPSQVVDPSAFAWTDESWDGLALADAVIYELHVGTFTPAGTFRGVTERLEYLKDLGITAIELMTIAEFAGRRNWGYDGVDLFAPSHRYGRPDDLRQLVDAAHRAGLAVILDVVYNHLGPDGAYLSAFSPSYFTNARQTPWGPAINLHGARAEHVRAFFIENALHWIYEYHVDGLRLDATHALFDEGRRPFLAQLAAAVHGSTPRRPLLIAEDDRNLASLAVPAHGGGVGLDALWADDFHHQVRRAVAGDREGYFRSYSGSAADLAETLRGGWFYRGQVAAHTGRPRGTDPMPLRLEQFVVCIQNHDQVGNRAMGDRLTAAIPAAAYRAVSALLLCAPETPLLFMGQEWGASTPFLFFTDHEPALGRAVTEGRRAEFADFAAFRDPAVRDTIPDPQDERTFCDTVLRWPELSGEDARALLRLYRALLAFRRTTPAMQARGRDTVIVDALDEATIALWRVPRDATPVVVIARLRGAGEVTAPRPDACRGHRKWATVLTTDDAPFARDPSAVPAVRVDYDAITVSFSGPSAVVLRGNGASA
ncbi:MAG TPA: malto-oligosyltrehalose trehalohydrolase [Vicinamibacterales bacterium]|nr:malto-oligosyltrehalose trehalohydrolase [Vicinamibacterales bacterium]